MTDNATPTRCTVTSQGYVSVRQPPSKLLMAATLEADGVTLELALDKLKRRRDATREWLRRLGAANIEFEEPTFALRTDADPLVQARRATARIMQHLPGSAPVQDTHKKIYSNLTATWSLEGKSADEILILLDSIQFEAADLTSAVQADQDDDEPVSVEEQMQRLVVGISGDDDQKQAPVFLFIARLDQERYRQALEQAVSRARAECEELARSVGRELGEISSIHGGLQELDSRNGHRMMARQHLHELLARSCYEPGEMESISNTLESVPFSIQIHMTCTIV